MIRIENVTKRWQRRGGREALRGVSLHVPPGSIIAVVGPNGAGKSTLLSILLGFVRPTAGTVTIDGDAPRDFVRDNGASYLPERFELPARWTAGESLRQLARMERTDADADVALRMFGLEPHAGQAVGTLSRGLRQRLGLAQALLAPRKLVVLDEPTEGLDPVWRVRLRDIVTNLRDDGATIIVASHDLAEVERIADRAVLLEDGRIREIIETRDTAAPTEYTVSLAEPFERLPDAFAGGEPIDPLNWSVTVATPADLTQRLAALIALGATVTAVEPKRASLEERVQQALGSDE